MQKQKLLYSGKAKSLYTTEDPDICVMEFRDDASAFDGVKKAQLARKGSVNNKMNAHFMEYLSQHGVKTHLIELLSDTESLVHKLKMFPVECVMRNYAAGSICRRLGIKEGIKFRVPIMEFFYKDDELHDPLINEYHIIEFEWATESDIHFMKRVTYDINKLLLHKFERAGLLLVDFKLEFGLDTYNNILLGDECTFDGCRVWVRSTKKKLDKDRFRQDLGNVIESYEEAAHLLDIDL